MGVTRSLRKALTRCALVAAAVAPLVLASAPAGAAPSKVKPLTPPEIAQRDQPAVELIETDVAGDLTYYKLNVNTDAIVTFAQNNQDIQSVGNAGNFGDVSRMMIGEITAHPDSYLGKGDPVSIHDELVYDGSGFNVTPDGYIVTNTHVAVVSKSDAIQGFVADTLGEATTGLTKVLTGELTNINFGGHPLAIPDDQQPAIKGLIGKFIDATAQAGNITTTVYAGGGPTLSRNLLHRGQVARVVASGDVFPGKDVAILKIDARNLPVLSLGDDAAMQTGDAVHAIGYPGDATFDPTQISDTVSADSTMSDGIVSNRLQSSKANYQIVENTATINHGSSGGPLVNDQGQVIGLTTASDASTEQKNGVNGGKFFFAVPSSVISELLTANHVVPAASPDQAFYNNALDLMSASHYKAAVTQLRQAEADGYNTPYLQARLDAANKAVAAGRDQPVSSSSPILLIVAIVVAALIVAGVVVLVLVKKRRRRPAGAAVPAAGAPAPFPPPPAAPFPPPPAMAPAAFPPPPATPFPPPPAPPPAAPPAPPAHEPPPPPPPPPPPLTQAIWEREPPTTQGPLLTPTPNGQGKPTEPATTGTVATTTPVATSVIPESKPPVSAPAPTAPMPAGWYPDPSGRHQLRYWNAGAWTPSVSDNGVAGADPI